MITRWDAWFSDDNLTKDERILAAPPSQSAESAAQAFLERGIRLIVDLACGVGRDTIHLASRGLGVIGVDASLNGLRVAQQRTPESGAPPVWIAANARHLPFRDGSLEGVYCFGLLHEFTDEGQEKDVEGVMGEVKRVLRDEGVLILTVLSGEPEAGLPKVQFFSRQMFDRATGALQTIEVREYDDTGCTGWTDYHVWYGVLAKPSARPPAAG